MAHVPYLRADDLPAEHRHSIRSQTVREGEPMHVLQALANNLPLHLARREYGAAVRADAGLTERERELAVLTIAHRLRSRYVWHQHVRFAVGRHVTAAELVAIAAGDDGPFDDAEATLVAFVRQFVDRATDDGIQRRLAAAYDHGTLVGTCLLASIYVGLTLTVEALGVEIEEDEFVGWSPTDRPS